MEYFQQKDSRPFEYISFMSYTNDDIEGTQELKKDNRTIEHNVKGFVCLLFAGSEFGMGKR